MYDDPDEVLNDLIGKKITEIHMNDDYLVFITDGAEVHAFQAVGDCCSWSYFHDFYGLEKLLENGPVVSARPIAVYHDDWEDEYGEKQAYGFEIVTEHPTWGEQTSVFSFRNESNGYYGGWIEKLNLEYLSNSFCDGSNRKTESF